MKTKLDLASYSVQEMAVAETQEVNGGGLSEVSRWVIENVSYAVHRVLRPVELSPTTAEARNFALGSLIN